MNPIAGGSNGDAQRGARPVAAPVGGARASGEDHIGLFLALYLARHSHARLAAWGFGEAEIAALRQAGCSCQSGKTMPASA